jgi:outer membrane receptor protein involved in Fe transport
MKRNWLYACASAAAMVGGTVPAFAQTEPASAPSPSPASAGQTAPGTGTQAPVSTETTSGRPDQNAQIGDIIVTANKRAQSINDVGVTIQAADASVLSDRGIGSPADLGKLVPGFTYTESLYSTPVFTLRGIGLYDATFGAAPAVSVYTDQIPRNVPVMSDALDLDLERIEVLKGPQGTLFGQSSTGGAINYILAKPTDTAKAGFDVSYERFDRVVASAFVSSPLTDTLGVRGAIRVSRGGAWQYSISRPDDENGTSRKFEGRLTTVWKPTSDLKFELLGTIVDDSSDVQAPQYLGTQFNIYSAASLAAANANPTTRNPNGIVNDALYASITTPGSPNYDASFTARQATVATRLNTGGARFAPGAAAILGTRPGGDSRQAEWTPGFLQPSDNRYYQGSLRGDYSLGDVTLTSVTAFARKTLDYFQDLDGTVARAVDVPIYGTVATFNQEVRIAGEMDSLNWIIGGTYDNIRSTQTNFFDLYDYSGNAPLGPTGPFIELTKNDFASRLQSYAGFGNAEVKLGALTILGGVRYTRNNQTASYCYNDPNNAGPNTVFSIFQNLFTGAAQPPLNQPGLCFPLGDGLSGTTFGVSTRTPVNRSLNEDNWSFRGGANYKLGNGGLLYATVSQGYKTGIFSAIGASSTSQYAPATQEKVVAYEGGLKLPLADRRVNINAAGFYYDYSDKQVRGRINDAIYGLLEKLINVPKSYVYGFEADVLLRPLEGLTLSASGTYLKSKVNGDFSSTTDSSAVYNSAGYTGNFRGSQLPYTPEWSANADVQYQFDAGDYRPFVGGNVLYQGKQNATFSNNVLRADDFQINDYTTFDVRAGVEPIDGRWKISVFGRNITNKTYTTSVTTYLDTLFRFTGRPVTYGASFSLRY